MAFNTAPGRAEYTATAGQTVFTYVFKAYNETDIKVYLTPAGQTADDTTDLLTITTDYTVVISGDVGGTITLVVPATNGDKITLVRTLEIDRQIEYQTSGDLLADTLNQDQNYQTYLIADKESDNTRFLKLQESAQGVSTEIPSPVPLNFFQWNATGDAIVNVDSLQADGFLWTAADVYTKAETYSSTEVDTLFNDNAKLWDGQTTTHDFTTDADYTLTAEQNNYGRIVLTDTGVILTTSRNVITDNIEKSFIVQNDTAQTITVKTLAGTGIDILAGNFANLYNNSTDIISLGSTPDTRLNAINEGYAGQAADEEILNANAGEWIKNQSTAWVNFDGTTTPPTIRDAYNINDVIRTATGVFDVYFSANMDNTNYSISISTNRINNNSGTIRDGYDLVTVSKYTLRFNDAAGTAVNPYSASSVVTGGKA